MRVLVRIMVPLALIGGGLLAVDSPASANSPTVNVTPSTSLVGGQSVVVGMHGLPPNTSVLVNQCEFATDIDPGSFEGCFGGVTTVTNGSGRAKTSLVLHDVVNAAVHDPVVDLAWLVPCRDDHCQIFANWIDDAGDHQSAISPGLEFVGSPATVTAHPNDELVRDQRVRVHGTAFGGEGRTVVVSEEKCVGPGGGDLDTHCAGTIVRGTTSVRSDGTWNLGVNVRRFLPGGLDCTDLGGGQFDVSCRLRADVLHSGSDTIDYSFYPSTFLSTTPTAVTIGFHQKRAA
jgi:hypothetical protein